MTGFDLDVAPGSAAVLEPENIMTFILAGKAIFTISNAQTGNHLTYKVSQCEDKPTLYFVSVLTGSDNENDYRYLGTIRDGGQVGYAWQYQYGHKSKIAQTATSAKAFQWFWEHRRALPACVTVEHAGHCGRCGRTLTVPESIQSGFGPECIKKLAA